METENYQLEGNLDNFVQEEELKKWNWGGFMFGWLWGVFNGVIWPLVAIPCNFIPKVGPLISLGIGVYLGLKGTRMAWEKKTWESYEQFKRVQHNWAVAGIIVFCISLVIGVIIGLSQS